MRSKTVLFAMFSGILLLAFWWLWLEGAGVVTATKMPTTSSHLGQKIYLKSENMTYVNIGSVPITFTAAYTSYLPFIEKNINYNSVQTIVDPALDVGLAHIDVLSLESNLNNQMLESTFYLRDVPAELTFNRVGAFQNHLEYEWSVYVDVDNDPNTGYSTDLYPVPGFKGVDYLLAAKHFVNAQNSPVSLPIPDGVQVNTWKHVPGINGWSYENPAEITVNLADNTITLKGQIPGLNPDSRLYFVTFDLNPYQSSQTDLPE